MSVSLGPYELSPSTQVVLSDPYAIKVLQPKNKNEQIAQRDQDQLTGIRVYYEDLVISQELSQEMVSMSRAVVMATFVSDLQKNGMTSLLSGHLLLEVVGLNPPNKHGCMEAPLCACCLDHTPNPYPLAHLENRPHLVQVQVHSQLTLGGLKRSRTDNLETTSSLDVLLTFVLSS